MPVELFAVVGMGSKFVNELVERINTSTNSPPPLPPSNPPQSPSHSAHKRSHSHPAPLNTRDSPKIAPSRSSIDGITSKSHSYTGSTTSSLNLSNSLSSLPTSLRNVVKAAKFDGTTQFSISLQLTFLIRRTSTSLSCFIRNKSSCKRRSPGTETMS